MDRMTLLERELESLRGKLAKIDAENNILNWELASEISQSKHLEQMLNEARDDLARVMAEHDELRSQLDNEHDAYILTLGERDGFEAKSIVLSHQLKAALEDLNGFCWACAHGRPAKFGAGRLTTCDYMQEFNTLARGGRCKCEHWQWRGPRKGDGGNDA